MKKKILTLLSAICFSVIGLAACSSSGASTAPVPDFVGEYEAEMLAAKEAAAKAAAITPTPKPTATPTPTPKPGVFSDVVGPADVTIDFTDLTFLSSYGTKHSLNKDGSATFQYQGKYSEAKFLLPETLDMTCCTGITVQMKSETDNLAIKLLDSASKQAFVFYDGLTTGVEDIELVPNLTSTIASIAFMGGEDVATYFDYATVYSITFHFSEGFDGSTMAK